MKVTSHVSPPLTWHISQVVVNCLFCFVTTCLLNHSCGYWLFSDVLHFIITMSLKLKEEVMFAFYVEIQWVMIKEMV